MKPLAAAVLALAALIALGVTVVAVDLAFLPSLWPLEIDLWSFKMATRSAYVGAALALLGGLFAAVSWQRKPLAIGLAIVCALPGLAYTLANDTLAVRSLEQLPSEGYAQQLLEDRPHLRERVITAAAAKIDDPYFKYLTRANLTVDPGQRRLLAEAELDRVLALALDDRMVGLGRLTMSPVGDFAQATLAQTRLETQGIQPGPPGRVALQQLLLAAITSKVDPLDRKVHIVKSDTTVDRFRAQDFWPTCNVSGNAWKAGLLFGGTVDDSVGRLELHRTGTVGNTTYVTRDGETVPAQFPDFSGYARVLDAEGVEVFRVDVAPGSLVPDATVFLSAGDNLDYELSKSLSAGFCLKIAEAFGGF